MLSSYLVSALAQESQQRSRRNNLEATEVATPASSEHTLVARSEIIDPGVQRSGDDGLVRAEAHLQPTVDIPAGWPDAFHE